MKKHISADEVAINRQRKQEVFLPSRMKNANVHTFRMKKIIRNIRNPSEDMYGEKNEILTISDQSKSRDNSLELKDTLNLT